MDLSAQAGLAVSNTVKHIARPPSKGSSLLQASLILQWHRSIFSMCQRLRQVIEANAEYRVLLCVVCRHAIVPGATDQHFLRMHGPALQLRDEVNQYAQESRFPVYGHRSVRLPEDGLQPQPLVPVVSGFICRDCGFKNPSQEFIRKRSNKVHDKQGVPLDERFTAARLQSWFGEKRERYWAV
jgi:hypothetical protein